MTQTIFDGSAFLLAVWIVALALLAYWIGWLLTKDEREERWQQECKLHTYWQRQAMHARQEAQQLERSVAMLQHDVWWLNQTIGRKER